MIILNRDSRFALLKQSAGIIRRRETSSMSNDISVRSIYVLRKSLTSRKIWGYILSPMCRSVEFEIDYVIHVSTWPRYAAARGSTQRERSFSKKSLSHLRILAGSVLFFIFFFFLILAIKIGKKSDILP